MFEAVVHEALAEAPLWIELNGERRIVLSCSPSEPAPLAIGHLLSEGWIDRLSDITAWRVAVGGVSVELDETRVAAMDEFRRHQLERGCGLRHLLDCDRNALLRASPATAPDNLPSLFRALFKYADAASDDGGLHAAAVSDGARLIHATTDVARHCAVDRAIGMALLADPIDGAGLVLTSRVSGAIALKAARAHIGWIASRSIATSLAREICDAAGMALLERAGRA